MQGIERRIEAGLDPDVASVASIFISRWDVAVADEVPDELRNRLGDRGRRPRLPRLPRAARLRPLMQRLMNEGARPQRLLWASTGTKDPDASDTLYIEALRLAVHGQHDARADPARLRRPRRGRRAAAGRRRRRRAGAGRVRARPGSTSTRSPTRLQDEGKESLQQVLGRAAEVDRRPSAGSRPGERARRRRCARRPPGRRCRAHYERDRATPHLRDLFAADPERGERLVADGAGLHLDFSKNRITDETLMLLGELARERGVEERREAMFAGEHINVSEDRAVLHVALRMPRERSLIVDGVDVVKEVHETLDRMGAFAERVRSGEWTRPHRQADPQRRQHRHRRLRPRPGDGLRGAAPLLAAAR